MDYEQQEYDELKQCDGKYVPVVFSCRVKEETMKCEPPVTIDQLIMINWNGLFRAIWKNY